ncbi:MAG: Re/Si-specific NAD(P)(+) transhydrogenase subunit alpha [Prosthecobacter sp.]|jgi:NAD(P) transhydrogenase subunit alpha|uniref:Re/Si-specific NAD(P)(+) transhydrogenase subunit alpha n=1 Tax=Prosthecobacter sp. TaxID=1965333 RepID=UPI0019FDA4A4|nr:Re/Si-specific NAD(P)(+) transhydrogenase subunit alpha [Prosthecobacter sp.]MBE2283705.1 Re/Si-specific NAD(P)(+) transhydrogenase subunit alpha [Prosthecobacter sp.]
MTAVFPKETHAGESRAAAVPEQVAKLKALGLEIEVEAGVGASCGHTDDDYANAGATVRSDRAAMIQGGDIVARVRKPSGDDVAQMRDGTVCIALLDPFQSPDLIKVLAQRGVTAISLEMIPRSTRAQKMDVLSSQASLAGYAAVITAAAQTGKIFPMMMTPAGTIKPVKVFIIGAGVAGLQAIATAKRLGAKVDAFDTRPAVEEQVRSLGAKFVRIEVGETGQTEGGYAKALTDEQLKLQREGMTRVCAESDIVITAAQVFGRRAPILLTKEMLDAMKPGSVVVDLAVESGGNVEGVVADQITGRKGVKIVGTANLPGTVPVHASQMFSSNITALITEFWDKESRTLKLNLDDDILKSCVVTHGGRIVNEKLAAT